MIIDASKSVNIDQDVIEIIEDFGRSATYKNIKVELIHIKENDIAKDPFKEFERTILNKPEKKKELVNET